MAYDIEPIGLNGFGDMAYDIEPIGLNGFGDMAYDILPSADPFGLGYGGFGSYVPLRPKVRKYHASAVPTTDYQPLDSFGRISPMSDTFELEEGIIEDFDGLGVVETETNLVRLRQKRSRLQSLLRRLPRRKRTARAKVRRELREVNSKISAIESGGEADPVSFSVTAFGVRKTTTPPSSRAFFVPPVL